MFGPAELPKTSLNTTIICIRANCAINTTFHLGRLTSRHETAGVLLRQARGVSAARDNSEKQDRRGSN